jgi:hypothetical protein
MQGGSTRSLEGSIISTISANAVLPLSWLILTRSRSPAAASETKTVKPSANARPKPLGTIFSMVTSRILPNLFDLLINLLDLSF